MGQCISSMRSVHTWAVHICGQQPPGEDSGSDRDETSNSDEEEGPYAPPPAAVLAERYVSPLSAAHMVDLATSLLQDPHWGPHLRRTFPVLQDDYIGWQRWENEDQLQAVGEMRQACPHLAVACATGLALTLPSLCGKRHLHVKCDDAGEEAVAAFYAALEQPTCTVEALFISGAAFGTPAAAAHLGRCLNVNSTIKALYLWHMEGFHSEAVWTAFSHALTSNATLQYLYLQGRSYSRHVGAALAYPHKLSALTSVTVSASENAFQATLEDMEMWGIILKHNSSITHLRLEFWLPQGGLLVPVCQALLTNTTLQQLYIGYKNSHRSRKDEMPRIYDNADALSLEAMLRTNRTLTKLNILHSGIVCNALVVEQGLSQNTNLETLSICMDAVCAQALMNALTPSGAAANNLGPPLKSLELGSWFSPQGFQCFPRAVAVGNMLASNNTLTLLDLSWAPYNNQEWATTILPALASNHTLEVLYLDNCRGVDGGLVYDTLLQVLDANLHIIMIRLDDTPLDQDGKAAAVKAMLQSNEEYGAALKNVPTAPTTSCRLVLCGSPFAGKTTLLQTMMSRHSSRTLPVTTTNQRTRGIDIQALTIDDLTMWVWDFAGQREFHPLQDFIFPNATSVHAATAFVFTFNPIIDETRLKKKHEFEHEISYWLKFIRSNATQRPASMCKPLVLVVVTHNDKIGKLAVSTDGFHMMVEEWVRDVALEFKGMVDLDEDNLFFVDATDKDDSNFTAFEGHAIKVFRDRIGQVVQVPAVCDAIAKALGEASGGQQLKPIISFADFQKLCESVVKASTTGNESQQKALKKLMSGTKDKAARVIAAYLRDAGEVLYFSDLDFLVRNPRWFAHGILGYLIDIAPQDNDEGNLEGTSHSASQVNFMFGSSLVSEKLLAKLLQQAMDIVGLDPAGTTTDQLILLMEKLDLCYKTGEKYLIPALLPDKDGKAERGECKREWLIDLPLLTSRCIFVSRRLQCSDRLRTFITPGFFPRLQVMLQRKADEWDTSNGTNYGKPKQACELEKYFCRLRHDGMEILVEHSGSFDYFVDIMVKSYKSQQETEKFLKSEIIDEIRRLCASSRGCQGVTLAEAIIRPDCVRENIMPCRYRQSILTADLKKGMDSVPEFKCYWEEVEDDKGTMLLPADMHDPQRLLDGVPQEACECYPDWNVKKGRKRGLAVIISMEKYDLTCAERSGGREDRENLEALAHSLDFEVHVMVDFTADDVLQSLRTIAKESILEQHESFVCFANGHGGSTDDKYELHYLKDPHGDMLFLDDIVRPFRRCEHLQGKPKVFFVNSCRGSNKLRVDEQQCGSSVQQATSSQQVRKEASEYEYVEEIKDCLIFFSTSGRSVSTRKPGVGTSFVLALKNAFTKKRQVLDVLGIVCCATNEVAAEEHKWRNETSGEVATLGQCPVHVSSLTKLLYWR